MNEQLQTLEHAKRTVLDLAIQFGPKLFVALIIVVVGFLVGRWAAASRAAGLQGSRSIGRCASCSPGPCTSSCWGCSSSWPSRISASSCCR